MPSTGGYLVSPRSIALIAACLMLSGVSKSGSPTESEITSRPLALRSRAFCVIAMVADGLTRERTSARKATGLAPFGWGRKLSGAAIVRRAACATPANGPEASKDAGDRTPPRTKLRDCQRFQWLRCAFVQLFYAAQTPRASSSFETRSFASRLTMRSVEFGAIMKLHRSISHVFTVIFFNRPRGMRKRCPRKVSPEASTEPKSSQNETVISRSETNRFASRHVSRWNPYERRISHFARLFVFSGLTPVSFRRFHGLFVSNGLAPFFISPIAP